MKFTRALIVLFQFQFQHKNSYLTLIRKHQIVQPSRWLTTIMNTQVQVQDVLQAGVENCSISANSKDTPEEGSTTTLSLSSKAAILRYQSGAERYQLSCSFKGKPFNFDRSSSEPISIFLGRLTSNVSKKVKQFEGSANFLLDGKVLEDTSQSFATILSSFDGWSTSEASRSRLTLQIDNEVTDIEINPPEIYKIKLLKSAMVGLPILPVKLEGSPNFNSRLSSYLWEFTQADDAEIKKYKMKNYKKLLPNGGSIWSACASSRQDKDSGLVLVPDKSLLNAKLRLTCCPSADGIQFGHSLTVEMASRVSPIPASGFLFQERLGRLNGKPTSESNPRFLRIVTYNTLADTYATKEWFSASPEESLDIYYRLPIINSELEQYQGDVICLQEVDDKYFEHYFDPFLSSCGYKGLFCCKAKSTKEGIALFYNRNKLKAQESIQLDISEHMKTLDFYKTLLKLKYDKIIERLDERNTVLQVVVLESILVPDTLLILANTHLFFQPDADHIRLLQTMTCLDYIEAKSVQLKLAHPKKKVSVIFCGDFNCTPPYSSFRAVTTGRIQHDDFDWTSHDSERVVPGIEYSHNLGLVNSHPDHELTNIVINFKGCLDYMFYQPNIELLKIYAPPSKATVSKLCGVEERKISLPNLQCPSDHLPLIADFNL